MTVSDLVAIFVAAALLYIAWAVAPAAAQTEREYVEHLCEGMQTEVVLPDNTRADCLSATTVYEVGFSATWAESIGQALHYSRMTSHEPGIILICRQRPETCRGHLERVLATAEYWKLPLRVWMHSGGLD